MFFVVHVDTALCTGPFRYEQALSSCLAVFSFVSYCYQRANILAFGRGTYGAGSHAGFEGRCLRRILRIRWEQRVTNKEISRRTGINNIVKDVTQRRWRWFGHVLRMNKNRHPSAALRWTPPGKRKRGRPLGTWRRTIEEKMKAAGKTWNEVSWLAQDRDGWNKSVSALCSTRSEED